MKKILILSIICLAFLAANAANKHYALRGTLGENIEFRLDIEEDPYHKIVMGQTTYYRKNGQNAKIKVYGNVQQLKDADENLRFFMLSEFVDTKICGNFTIALDEDGYFNGGSWSFGEKSYEIHNVEFLPIDDSLTFFKPVEIENASGVYEFSYASGNTEMAEYGGTLQLYAYCDNIAYQICQVTPNIAETTGKMAEIFKNRFYIFVNDAHYEVFAFEDVVFVKRINPQTGHPEDFGANADIEGCYIATGRKPEGEVMTLFDEELEFGEKYHFSVFQLNAVWQEITEGETTFPDEILVKDIDGDGKEEIIARYTENRTDDYEVRGSRCAVFVVEDDFLGEVAVAQGVYEDLEIANGYVIKNTRNSRGSRITHNYFHLENSLVDSQATMTEAEINNFTIDGSTVKEKVFKKHVKAKKAIKVTDLDGWLEVPGNVHRNETAARG